MANILSHDSLRVDSPYLLSLEPVKSCSPEASLAVALAVRSSPLSSKISISVVQFVISSNADNGSISFSAPHNIYDISHDVNSPHIKFDLAATEGPYSFKYTVTYDSKYHECKDFTVNRNSQVGQFRLLLAMGKFDEADRILASTTNLSPDSIEYMHCSEIALWRLRKILADSNVSTAGNTAEAKSCLSRLAMGAVTGGDIGIRCLLEASRSISAWPVSDVNVGVSRNEFIPSIKEYRLALTAMTKTIKGVMSTNVPLSYTAILEEEMRRLDMQYASMKCLEQALKQITEEIPSIYLSRQHHVSSSEELYQMLMSQGFLTVAELVRRSNHSRISHGVIATSVTSIPFTLDPRFYTSWLKDFVITDLTVNHPLLLAIRKWACHAADAFDDDSIDTKENSLSASIILLKAVCDATAKSSASAHSSFANYSPFVEDEVSLDPALASALSNNASCHSPNTSRGTLSPFTQSHSPESDLTSLTHDLCATGTKSTCSVKSSHSRPPNPTVLQLSLYEPPHKITAPKVDQNQTTHTNMSTISGITPISPGTEYSMEDDVNMNNQQGDCETKLTHALELEKARKLGLSKDIISLKDYIICGGAKLIARELISIFSKASDDDIERRNHIKNYVKPFCETSSVNFDESIEHYTTELCETDRGNPKALLEAASLACCCDQSTIKCRIVLKILRTFLLCADVPESLFSLSRAAITWATDERIKSELEEAERLLVIDNIVLRYCGNGARDFFRIADPQHGSRLMKHVCCFVDTPNVLKDALALCDAFAHLSREKACILILENMVLAHEPTTQLSDQHVNSEALKPSSRADQSALMMSELYRIDVNLAEEVGTRVISFCSQTLIDCNQRDHWKEKTRRDSLTASAVACSILVVIQDNSLERQSSIFGSFSKLGSQNWASLLKEFQRIASLQKEFGLYLNLTDLRDDITCKSILLQLFNPVIEILLNRDHSKTESNDFMKDGSVREITAKAKRASFLLFGRKSSQWCEVVGIAASRLSSDDSACYCLLETVGIIDEGTDNAEAVLIASKSLLGSAMREIHTSSSSPPSSDESWLIQASPSCLPAMKCVLRSLSFLQEQALITCSDESLGSTVGLMLMTEIVSQALVRSDKGIGEIIDGFKRELHDLSQKHREPFSAPQNHSDISPLKSSLPPPPKLHPSWYVGDGLLLPPLETLSHSMTYFLDSTNFNRSPDHQRSYGNNSSHELSESIFSFLGCRGAYFLAFQMLVSSAACTMDRNGGSHELDNHLGYFDDTLRLLAERSLGGSGNGIITGTIDSQLAVAYLLCLPMKTAFKVYQSALPSAISRRDFARVITLANIGACASGGESRNKILPYFGWQNQETFACQCYNLACNAQWWKLLQHYGVTFDPCRFGDDYGLGRSSEKRNGETSSSSRIVEYASSLMELLISAVFCSSKGSNSPDFVLALAIKFGSFFGCSQTLAPQKYIVFVLSWHFPEQSLCDSSDWSFGQMKKVQTSDMHCDNENLFDIRYDLKACEDASNKTLLLLPSTMARAAVMRKCVISLEDVNDSWKDYERHSIVLSLYQRELSKLLAEREKNKEKDVKIFREELYYVERRQDTLILLCSFFDIKKVNLRPDYPTLFPPFPNPFGPVDRSMKLPGVLGKGSEENVFDPLKCLEDLLTDDSTTSALAPLCQSLGLPTGFIHARSLCTNFLKMKKSCTPLPTFEFSVLPVLNRLRAEHGSELAYWCAFQYDDGCHDRLKSLEYALSLAMKVSSDIERWRQKNASQEDNSFAQKEQQALNLVKKIDSAHSLLADKMEIERILGNSLSGTVIPMQVRLMINKLVDSVRKYKEIAPELFVEFLLTEASKMVAVASLDETYGFTIDHFRDVAFLIHSGCTSLAEKYSHVHVGNCARALVRRWMLHGDAVMNPKDPRQGDDHLTTIKEHNVDIDHGNPQPFNQDETTTFVMDLNNNGAGHSVWSDDIGSDLNPPGPFDHVTIVEEPSAFKRQGSPREISEYANARASLRIAFVISFADGYFTLATKEVDSPKENIPRNRLFSFSSKSEMTGAKSTASNCPQKTNKNMVIKAARELLGIVFAKSGTALRSPLTQLQHSLERSRGNTLTFAMRYRALRAASVLCPQEVLELIVREEGFFKNNPCSLKSCTFGAFIAMEIEAMGLPLPHSDLVQLSNMHFPSYARALWRHHGQSECKGFKGRLLRLLLELCLKDSDVSDMPLVVTILREMLKAEVPRSLLFGCELIAKLDMSGGPINTLTINDEGKRLMAKFVSETAFTVLTEIRKNISNEIDILECMSVMNRLGHVVVGLCGKMIIGQDQVIRLSELLCDISRECGTDKCDLADGLLELAFELSVHGPREGGIRTEFFRKAIDGRGALKVLYKCFGELKNITISELDTEENMSHSKAVIIERSLSIDLLTAIENSGKMEEFLSLST